MKIVDKEIFEIAQIYAKQAVRDNDNYCWMCAKEDRKMAYGL